MQYACIIYVQNLCICSVVFIIRVCTYICSIYVSFCIIKYETYPCPIEIDKILGICLLKKSMMKLMIQIDRFCLELKSKISCSYILGPKHLISRW
jgi:hypothetical protein